MSLSCLKCNLCDRQEERQVEQRTLPARELLWAIKPTAAFTLRDTLEARAKARARVGKLARIVACEKEFFFAKAQHTTVRV